MEKNQLIIALIILWIIELIIFTLIWRKYHLSKWLKQETFRHPDIAVSQDPLTCRHYCRTSLKHPYSCMRECDYYYIVRNDRKRFGNN